MYTITVHNRQGASEQYKGKTKAAINKWLRSWSDPETLVAIVRDGEGREVGNKARGPKRITWPELRGRPLTGAEARRPIEVTLMPSTIDRLRKLGGGSVSTGIERLSAMHHLVSCPPSQES